MMNSISTANPIVIGASIDRIRTGAFSRTAIVLLLISCTQLDGLAQVSNSESDLYVVMSDSVTPLTLPDDPSPLEGRINPSSLFFPSVSTGFYGPRYRTSDSGKTWSRLDSDAVIPYYAVDNALLVNLARTNPDRTVSFDSGKTWTSLQFQDSTVERFIQLVIGGTGGRLAGVVRRDREQDAILVVSTDRGTTWIAYSSPGPESVDTTSFTSLSWYWDQPIAFTNNAIHATWILAGRESGVVTSRLYQVRIPIDSGPYVIKRMPGYSGLLWWDGSNALVLGTTRDSAGTHWKVVASSDSGTTWSIRDIPSWLKRGDLRFFSSTFGVSSNGRTFDGGQTWVVSPHPFQAARFYAADSAVYYVGDAPSFLARTTDAGISWARNRPATPVTAADADSGHLVAGRTYQSLIASTNAGDSWIEAGVVGTVPSGLFKIHAIRHVPTPGLHRVVAVASIFPDSSISRLHVMESDDGGVTWRAGQDLGIEKPPASVTVPVLLRFAPDYGGADSVGCIVDDTLVFHTRDHGTTWYRLDTLPFRAQHFEMADAWRWVAAMIPTMDGRGGIWTTEDQGSTWTKVFETISPRVDVKFGSLYCSGDSIRVILADPNQLGRRWDRLESNDFGRNWTRTEHASPELRAYTITWVNTEHAYAIDRGAVYETRNSGRNWNRIADSGATGYPLLDQNYFYVLGTGVGIRIGITDSAVSVVPISRFAPQSTPDAHRVALPHGARVIPIRAPIPPAARAVLYDLRGSEVGSWEIEEGAAETLRIPNAVPLVPGMYVVVADGEEVAQVMVHE